jgi:hypothetical protein
MAVIRPTADAHNWEITGVSTQNGVQRMHVKWWGGQPKWFGRAAVNALTAAKGSDCLTDVDGKATPADIQTVKLTIMQTLVSYLQRLLAWYQAQQAEGVQETLPEAQNAPSVPITTPNQLSMPTSPKPDMLTRFCTAIMNFEGGPGDPNHVNNNPGDFRCSPVGYLPKYGHVLCRNNFAVFPTFELGWEYLLASVHYRAVAHPNWTILDFFMNYAPPSDNNPTAKYAATVAKACGVSVSTTLAELFA